jgi:hypothetical protein
VEELILGVGCFGRKERSLIDVGEMERRIHRSGMW